MDNKWNVYKFLREYNHAKNDFRKLPTVLQPGTYEHDEIYNMIIDKLRHEVPLKKRDELPTISICERGMKKESYYGDRGTFCANGSFYSLLEKNGFEFFVKIDAERLVKILLEGTHIEENAWGSEFQLFSWFLSDLYNKIKAKRPKYAIRKRDFYLYYKNNYEGDIYPKLANAMCIYLGISDHRRRTAKRVIKTFNETAT